MTTDRLWWGGLAILCVMAYPFVLLYSVKLCSYAYHRGKQLAERKQRKD